MNRKRTDNQLLGHDSMEKIHIHSLELMKSTYETIALPTYNEHTTSPTLYPIEEINFVAHRRNKLLPDRRN